MKKSRVLEILCVMISLSLNVKSQTTIDGEFRPRIEARDGFRRPLADSLKPAFIGMERTRININYKGNYFNTKVTLQDSRVFGNNDTKSSASKIEIYEAWTELIITRKTSVTIGRQMLSYDDERIFCTGNWLNSGFSHDLILFKFNDKLFKAHAGFAYNNNYTDSLYEMNYTISKMYKSLGYLWISKIIEPYITISGIAVREGFQKNSIDFETIYPRVTCGGTIANLSDSSKLKFRLSGYYQFGRSNANSITGFDNLNAFLLAFNLNYKIFNRTSVFVGTDLYSGSSPNLTSGKSNTYNRLYGSIHGFNGSMEYWLTLPKAGLIDYYTGLTGKLLSKYSTVITYHFFRLEQDYSSTNKSRNLGSEIDLKLDYNLTKESSIELGYSYFFLNDLTNKVKKCYNIGTTVSTPSSHQWCYIMFTIRPQFYKTPDVNKI